MALKSTVYKADLQITDLDRHYYANHPLTLALHPSETEERLMVRLLAFAHNASEFLQFTQGLDNPDDPALWEKDLTGALLHWIDLGQPDERRLQKACGRAERVSVYCYGGNSTTMWWSQLVGKLGRLDNLTVLRLPEAELPALTALASRSLRLEITIQDGEWFVSSEGAELTLHPEVLFPLR
ncbi:MAG: YaeQ family protein [Moraxellaceae bacterium]|nr:YaeQ family protein [Moraxellaceae bacterium]